MTEKEVIARIDGVMADWIEKNFETFDQKNIHKKMRHLGFLLGVITVREAFKKGKK